jgi:hypothetical protein
VKRLCLRLLDASMGHRANVYVNGELARGFVASCGPFWVREHVTDEDGMHVIRDGELVTRLRFGLVQVERLPDLEALR